MSRKQKKPKPGYDPAIMDEILNQPKVKEMVAELTPDELKQFKLLLVQNGMYGKHVRMKQNKLLRSLARNMQWN